jgi:hypothetical protein
MAIAEMSAEIFESQSSGEAAVAPDGGHLPDAAGLPAVSRLRLGEAVALDRGWCPTTRSLRLEIDAKPSLLLYEQRPRTPAPLARCL